MGTAYAIRDDGSKDLEYQMFVETRERYEKRHNLIVSLPEGDVVRPPRKFEKIVVKAAEWIDDNPPPHVTDSNGLQNGMSMGARRFCSFGSSFVHGGCPEFRGTSVAAR